MSRLLHDLPIIEDVVAGRYRAPELGGPLRTAIRKIAVADSLEGAPRGSWWPASILAGGSRS